LNITSRIRAAMKTWLLRRAAKKLNSGKTIRHINRILDIAERNSWKEEQYSSRNKSHDNSIEEFFREPTVNNFGNDDLFVIIYPSSEVAHMSNHVLHDLVSLLKYSKKPLVEIFDFAESSAEDTVLRILKSEVKNKSKIWFVTVLHTSDIFRKKIIQLKSSMFKNGILICVVNDLWRELDQKLLMEMNRSVNIFIHMDPFGINVIDENIRKKMFFFPFAGLNQQLFYPSEKDLAIGFSGNVSSPYRRKILDEVLRKAKENELKTKFQAFIYQNRKAIPRLEDYALAMNQLSYCLDLSRKSSTHFLITGRSLESFASGCLLITDQPKGVGPLSIFFEPDTHYLAFGSIDELNTRIKELVKDQQYIESTRRLGHIRFMEVFGQNRLSLKFLEILGKFK